MRYLRRRQLAQLGKHFNFNRENLRMNYMRAVYGRYISKDK